MKTKFSFAAFNRASVIAFITVTGLFMTVPADAEDASPAHSYILAMAESGGSIYLAGHYNDGYKDIACYWKDGNIVDQFK
jgi:hypothetical protein